MERTRTIGDVIFEYIQQEPDNMEHYEQMLIYCKTEHNEDRFELSDKVKKFALEVGKPEVFEMFLLFEARALRFDSYMLFIESDRDIEKQFWLPRRKHLMSVVNEIQRLIDDELDILAISLPPGTGKSTLEIFLHSMMIGAFPDKPNLASGHSGMLTNSLYEGVMRIVEPDSEYRWNEVFPGKEIFTNAKEQTIDVDKKHRFSSLTCRAIGASLTGATRCENLLSADDLVSGIEEAMSLPRLEKLWMSYTNDLKSRKKLGCKELHLATRWSVHDVIGKLERMYEDDDRAKFLVIPALNDEGESNFTYDYNVGFDTQYYEDMKTNVDDVSFKALYMNRPIEREGLLYNVDELQRFFDVPDEDPEAIIAICDTKDRGTDYAFLPVGYKYKDDFYIVDCVCDNSLPEVVDARLAEILLRHKVQMCLFESNSAGGRVAEKVREIVKSKGGRTSISTKFTTSNKETKIIVNSAWVKENCKFKDSSLYTPQSEYAKMINFLTSYSHLGKNVNDDVPDGMAMFSEFAQSLSGKKPQIFQRKV